MYPVMLGVVPVVGDGSPEMMARDFPTGGLKLHPIAFPEIHFPAQEIYLPGSREAV